MTLNQDLGKSCNNEHNECAPGAFQRHIANGGKCYEFCANTNLWYSPDFRGSLAVGDIALNTNPEFMWPSARGSYAGFNEKAYNSVCNATDYSYNVTPFDYQTEFAYSAPGPCPRNPLYYPYVNNTTILEDSHPVNPQIPKATAKCTPDQFDGYGPKTNPGVLSCEVDTTRECPWVDGCLVWNAPSDPVTFASSQTVTCFSPEGMAALKLTANPSGICQLK